MTNKVTIFEDMCKGCSLCIIACPKKIVELSKIRINRKGYHVAEIPKIEQCTACGICAVICPDSAIKVEKE
jgi:2-oxoglutarate ferredoxin oxidoreductase subunit delta